MTQAEDIKPAQFPELSWNQQDTVQSLDKLFDYGIDKAKKAINWYFAKRKWKRFMGFTLRYTAIAFTAVAVLFLYCQGFTEKIMVRGSILHGLQ